MLVDRWWWNPNIAVEPPPWMKRGADFDGGAEIVVPELRVETLRVEKLAGIVPVPVVAIIAGSACCNSHSMVSPSDL